MRNAYWLATSVFLLSAAGCGGSSTSDSTGGAGGSAGSGTGGSGGSGTGGSVGGSSGSSGVGGTSAAGGSGGTTGGSGGATGGAGGSDPCTALLADVQAKLIQAKKCCLICAAVQCTGAVPGVCCDETVGSSESAETQDYLAALKAFQASGCTVACPEIVCPEVPSYQCGANAAGEGSCQ